ncbi:hypothetical protein AAF712_007285 [Marasmius tenuissimus]|uniref:DUF300-domain-containing protein n=1 Tax=Marasmius tenuissimus TaxID=585030 RepID=A0ABR2ZWV5_9AGAR
MAGEHSESNERCFKHRAEDGPSLLQHGNLVIQTHHIGWIIASFFTLVATGVSIWLVGKHLKWYTNKREQRHIVRILFLVPVYAIISLLSYFFWNHSTPLILLRDCYESTVLTSFFYLLLIYINPDPEEQRMIFRKVGLSREADVIARRKGEEVKKWVFPLGFVKSKPADGLYFLQAMKWGVLQYCVLRPLTTLCAVILDYIGLYCESSWSPGWGHIYIVLIVSLSVTVSMYCLIQLYVVAADYLAPHRPLLKLFAIKAVVFLTFWQATFLSTQYMTAEDINIGIGALLETFEMSIFAFLHIKAFTYKVYKPLHHNAHDLPALQTNRLRALGHAMDFRETFRELWAGCVYMWDKMRGREPEVDVMPRRQGYYENAFGRARPSAFGNVGSELREHEHTNGREGDREKEDPTFPSVRIDVDRQMHVGGQREWLGAGSYYGYGVHREKSDALEDQIEMELARRGYGRDNTEIAGKRGNIRPPTEDAQGHPRQRSWWRSLYTRVSQSIDHDHEPDSRLSPSPSRRARHSQRKSSRRSDRHLSRDGEVERDLLADYRHGIDDPPPPSLIRQYRANSQRQRESRFEHQSQRPSPQNTDILSPLSVYHQHRHSQMQRQQRRHTPPPAQLPSASPPRVFNNRPQSPPVLTSSPPPTSLLLSPPPDPYTNNNASRDTLLGRMFPSRSDLLSSTEHTDGGFMTSPPPSAANGHEIGMVRQGHGQVVQPHPSAPTPGRIDIINLDHPQPEDNPGYPSPSPRPSRPTVDVTPQPRPSRGLRRSSAQVYSPQRQQSRMHHHQHRQSLPAPVQVPQHSYMMQPHPSSRRRSTPMVLTVPAPLAPPPSNRQFQGSPMATQGNRIYQEDRIDSTIAQPSYSGTPEVGKYPSPPSPRPSHLRSGSNGRYPGLPFPSPRTPGSPTTPPSPSRAQNQRGYFTNHHFPNGGSPPSSPSPHS